MSDKMIAGLTGVVAGLLFILLVGYFDKSGFFNKTEPHKYRIEQFIYHKGSHRSGHMFHDAVKRGENKYFVHYEDSILSKNTDIDSIIFIIVKTQ